MMDTVDQVDKTVKTVLKDHKHNQQLDIIEQSQAVQEQYSAAQDKLGNVHIKLCGLEKLGSVGDQLESFQTYINQCEAVIDTVDKVNFTEDKLLQLKKELKVGFLSENFSGQCLF